MKTLNRPALLLLLLPVGCDDPLQPAQRLDAARVLGVRVASADDRSSLLPGEQAELQLLVAGPHGPVSARLAYELCEAANSDRGVPYCAAPAFAAGSATLDATPLPIQIPDSLTA